MGHFKNFPADVRIRDLAIVPATTRRSIKAKPGVRRGRFDLGFSFDNATCRPGFIFAGKQREMKLLLFVFALIGFVASDHAKPAPEKKKMAKAAVRQHSEYPRHSGHLEVINNGQIYHGKYGGKCGNDGLYYNDEYSFIICSNGNAYKQRCAPGSRNSGHNRYEFGKDYYYHDFCDVNMVDTGYGIQSGDSYRVNNVRPDPEPKPKHVAPPPGEDYVVHHSEGEHRSHEGYVVTHDNYDDGYMKTKRRDELHHEYHREHRIKYN